jgi:group I intron endonuclease
MDRLEAKRDYKQAKRPMGVYRIRNTRNGKCYVGFSTDLQARINRQKAELKFGSHRNAELLGEWKSFGESSFEFEVLDELAHDENSKANPAEELRILTEMWIRKLEKSGSSVVSL